MCREDALSRLKHGLESRWGHQLQVGLELLATDEDTLAISSARRKHRARQVKLVRILQPDLAMFVVGA